MIIFLWIFSIGFVADLLWKIVEYPWKRIDDSDAPTADAIVVLSSGGISKPPGKANVFEWGDPDRYFAGISLYQKKKAPRLFFTGGTIPYNNDVIDEGTLYKEHAISFGIPLDAIFVTKKVINTAQEAIEIRRNFNQINSSSKILLVTSAVHMKRAKKLFERQNFVVYPFPVDFKTSKISPWQSPYQWIPNSSSLNMSSKALRELIGRIIYRSW
ncbi:YdcF family protein [Prochlorococcus sp. MIT 1011]|uniref:YdcF family protein n=1 Tax=Prochlorococcus sp. MIT 1011 TaxID=3082520 RepID=UPI0039B5EE72